MAITCALRGSSLDLRYATGYKTPGQLLNTTGTPTTVTNSALAGMIGSSYIDCYQGAGGARHGLIYHGQNLWGARPFSILLRYSPRTSTSLMGVFSIASPSSESHALIKLFHGTDANLYLSLFDDKNNTLFSQTNVGASHAVNTFGDIVITCTGDTTANGLKIYKNAVLMNQYTLAAAATATKDKNLSSICVSYTPGAVATNIYWEEMVIWDEVIDPTSVALTSGTGSLNGTSRTAFVNVAAYDAYSYSDPGVANVKTGTSYTYAGNSQTGTYDGSDRWSDPGEANVKLGIDYEANDVAKTGTYSVTAATTADVEAAKEEVLTEVRKTLSFGKFMGLK